MLLGPSREDTPLTFITAVWHQVPPRSQNTVEVGRERRTALRRGDRSTGSRATVKAVLGGGQWAGLRRGIRQGSGTCSTNSPASRGGRGGREQATSAPYLTDNAHGKLLNYKVMPNITKHPFATGTPTSTGAAAVPTALCAHACVQGAPLWQRPTHDPAPPHT